MAAPPARLTRAVGGAGLGSFGAVGSMAMLLLRSVPHAASVIESQPHLPDTLLQATWWRRSARPGSECVPLLVCTCALPSCVYAAAGGLTGSDCANPAELMLLMVLSTGHEQLHVNSLLDAGRATSSLL